MIEHRVIEKMVHLLQRELDPIDSGAVPRHLFLRDTVDCLDNCVDRCHHDKEENMLFRELAKKPMPSQLKAIMAEPIAEHRFSRAHVARLSAAVEAGLRGSPLLDEVKAAGGSPVGAYPQHIFREGKHFFMPCMAFLDAAEQEPMLRESYESDMRLVHEHYSNIVKSYEVV